MDSIGQDIPTVVYTYGGNRPQQPNATLPSRQVRFHPTAEIQDSLSQNSQLTNVFATIKEIYSSEPDQIFNKGTGLLSILTACTRENMTVEKVSIIGREQTTPWATSRAHLILFKLQDQNGTSSVSVLDISRKLGKTKLTCPNKCSINLENEFKPISDRYWTIRLMKTNQEIGNLEFHVNENQTATENQSNSNAQFLSNNSIGMSDTNMDRTRDRLTELAIIQAPVETHSPPQPPDGLPLTRPMALLSHVRNLMRQRGRKILSRGRILILIRS
ncbi:hypothetical protein HOG98_06865 [bacterium]|jgi:hypothetical protein|nr:hypothetical protein [bacterium]